VTEPEGVRKYAGMILRNAEELTAMIENVLAFSASLRPAVEEPRQTFAIGDVLEHAVSVMAQEIEQAGCRMEVNVAPELPAVAGDPAALELAVRNLIGNAIRHGGEGKWVGVSAARWDGGVEVRVCDRGPGIPQREREKIFEPFYRGEQTRVQRIQGTGLGLSLVRKAVEKHRGTVTLDDSPGGGAQFTLRLPAASETA
jgi:two-component system, OmpR family, sensor histidine kinase SenX3